MEMCYDGALVMPSNYAVMDADEMTYVDGGSAKTFANNLIGLWNMSKSVRWALKTGGFSYAFLAKCAYASYSYCVLTVAVKLGVTVGCINWTLGALFAVGAVAAGIALWNRRIFY